ncbi:hypothetical protein BFJ72_g13947 [Fusarium proliferatum]|uniref:Uncharacterized protein n=1 Tax=Gibberella intermedia TaxID=948311 RepID=A0A420S9F9_GIBIN|nr:hypothetical protein BFJ72_g13947 [Fusarium proliferatum]
MNYASKQKHGREVGNSTDGSRAKKRLCVDLDWSVVHNKCPPDASNLISNFSEEKDDKAVKVNLKTQGHQPLSSEWQEEDAREFDTCFGMVNTPTSHLSILANRNAMNRKYGGLLGRNTTCSETIKKLYYQHGAIFEGYLLPSDTKNGIKATYDLYAIVYGMQSQSDNISELLDSARIFLQHPHFQDLSAPYQNPHYLCNPNSEKDLSSRIELSDAAPLEAAKILEDSDPLKNRLLNVMDSAHGPESFLPSLPSPRLKTVLKK